MNNDKTSLMRLGIKIVLPMKLDTAAEGLPTRSGASRKRCVIHQVRSRGADLTLSPEVSTH